MLSNPYSLSGQIAVITGGGSGIGQGVAQCMAAAGARVIVCGRRQEALENTCRQIGGSASYMVHDVTQIEQTEDLVKKIRQQAGMPHILVHCAGINFKKPMLQTSDAQFLEMLNTHLVGSYSLTRAMLPDMLEQGTGSILFISSMAAIFGIPYVSAYAAAKSGLLGIVRTLAVEVSGRGVRVNAIAPGWIETDMVSRAMENDMDRKNRVLTRTPMGCFGSTEDIGWGAVYLCSQAGRFITGQQLVIDGGVSIGF